MNDQGDWRLPHTERAVTGILRAMAQLLLSLAGDASTDGERGRAPGGRQAMRAADERAVREESSVPEPRPAREPRFAPPPMPEGGDDVELLLADARARAHEPHAARAAASRAVEAAPHGGPVAGVDTATAPAAHAPPPPAPPPPPSAAVPPVPAPPAVPLTSGVTAGAEPNPAVPTSPPVAAAMSQDATPPVLLAPVAARAEPSPPPNGQASAGGARPGPSVVFAASEGTVILRIAPVAGFQGLMRVQDALAQVPGVREAGVEAYAQGEARLRLQLAGNLDTEQLATSLSGQLGREARLAAASLTDRSITMTLD
ncbi:MAG: hypothetical protein EXR63_01965 [Dehalococcoidia bacterium]|nr:hypothetical protein [Dehalococcoidia bacterium]